MPAEGETPAPPDDSVPPVWTAILSSEDGAVMIAAAMGADVLFIRDDDTGDYAGSQLVPGGADFGSTLHITGPDTMEETATISYGAFDDHYLLSYTRVEGVTAQFWSEVERSFSDVGFFGPCLGRTDADPGPGWSNPDPIIPVIFGDEGSLTIDDLEFSGGGGSFVNESLREAGQSSIATTRTVTLVSDTEIEFTFEMVLDERDDCQVIYTSTWVPFDGDVDALVARAESLGTEEE